MSEGLGLDDFGGDPYGGMDELYVPVVDTASVAESLITFYTNNHPNGSASVGGHPDMVAVEETPVVPTPTYDPTVQPVYRIGVPIKEKLTED
jgi:hypothetical protein